MYPQMKNRTDVSSKCVLYCFRDRLEFEKCLRKKCSLVSSQNAYEATELFSAINLISSFAIEIWRLEKRLSNIAIPQDSQIDLSPTFDQIQRIKDIFQKEEVEVKDYTNENYNDGMSLKVLHFENDKNLSKGTMKIMETVKPTVVFKGQIISHGEVVVAKFQENNGKE